MAKISFQQAIADIRRSAQQSVQLQTMQHGVLLQMSGTLRSIHDEMTQVRKQMGEALAIQQELLARELIQAHLEEFIYQAQKLVAECSRPDTDMQPSTRFFLLRALVVHVGKEGIGTPIIKGRENKAAFDGMMETARNHLLALNQDAEVKQAIEWAEEQEERLRRKREREEREEKDARKRRREEDEAEEEYRRQQSNKTFQTVAIVIGTVCGLFILGCIGMMCMGSILPRR